MASGARFQANPSGIVEICKSHGMRLALDAAASSIAAEANGRAKPLISEQLLDGGRVDMDPYRSSVDELDHTLVGAVFTHTQLGRINEARNKTLSSLNH